MSHKCGPNCLRKQGQRCDACKLGRHRNREAGRLSTIVFLKQPKGQAKRIGQDTIDRWRKKSQQEEAQNAQEIGQKVQDTGQKLGDGDQHHPGGGGA